MFSFYGQALELYSIFLFILRGRQTKTQKRRAQPLSSLVEKRRHQEENYAGEYRFD